MSDIGRNEDLEIYGKERVWLAGSFKCGIMGDYASHTWNVTGTTDIKVTADSPGTGGNALDFQATADGRSISMATAAADVRFDSVVQFNEDGWKLNLIPGSGAAEGVNVEEDHTNKVLTLMYETAVSTFADFETAIGTTTHCSVLSATSHGTDTLVAATHLVNQYSATSATWAIESGSPSKTHLHFTGSVTTVAAAISAINALAGGGTKKMTASATGTGTTNLIATGDAEAKQDLAGATASGTVPATIRGWGISSVTMTAVGTYKVVLKDTPKTLIHVNASLALNAADDKKCIAGPYNSATNCFYLYMWDRSGAGLADLSTINAHDRINFILSEANSSLG